MPNRFSASLNATAQPSTSSLVSNKPTIEESKRSKPYHSNNESDKSNSTKEQPRKKNSSNNDEDDDNDKKLESSRESFAMSKKVEILLSEKRKNSKHCTRKIQLRLVAKQISQMQVDKNKREVQKLFFFCCRFFLSLHTSGTHEDQMC